MTWISSWKSVTWAKKSNIWVVVIIYRSSGRFDDGAAPLSHKMKKNSWSVLLFYHLLHLLWAMGTFVLQFHLSQINSVLVLQQMVALVVSTLRSPSPKTISDHLVSCTADGGNANNSSPSLPLTSVLQCERAGFKLRAQGSAAKILGRKEVAVPEEREERRRGRPRLVHCRRCSCYTTSFWLQREGKEEAAEAVKVHSVERSTLPRLKRAVRVEKHLTTNLDVCSWRSSNSLHLSWAVDVFISESIVNVANIAYEYYFQPTWVSAKNRQFYQNEFTCLLLN